MYFFQNTFAELQSVPVPEGFPTGEYEGQDAYNRVQYCHQNGMYFSQEDNNQGYPNTYDNVYNGAENTQYQYQNDSNQGHAPNAENQVYSTTQYSGNQENSQQEQQGNNIEYQNDSNEGHAPNDVQLGYQPDDEDGDDNVDTFAPCNVCYQKKCRYISKQGGHDTHKCICDACHKWKGRNKDKILNLDCSRPNKCNRADPVKTKKLCNNCRMYRVRLMGHL